MDHDALNQLFRGTLHLLLLRCLAAGPLHGYAVASLLAQRTGNRLELEDGALYQALHRMEERGWLESSWGLAESGKRARFYRVTRDGRRRLQLETDSWRRYVAAVNQVLEPLPL